MDFIYFNKFFFDSFMNRGPRRPRIDIFKGGQRNIPGSPRIDVLSWIPEICSVQELTFSGGSKKYSRAKNRLFQGVKGQRNITLLRMDIFRREVVKEIFLSILNFLKSTPDSDFRFSQIDSRPPTSTLDFLKSTPDPRLRLSKIFDSDSRLRLLKPYFYRSWESVIDS